MPGGRPGLGAASLHPLSLPLLGLSSPGKGGATGSWWTVLEQRAPQCCVHTRAMGAGGMVVCSWVRLFSLSPFLICRMSTVPLPGYPVLRGRGATAVLGIESKRGILSPPCFCLAWPGHSHRLDPGPSPGSASRPNWKMKPLPAVKPTGGLPWHLCSALPPEDVSGKAFTPPPTAPLDLQGQLSVAACPHTPTPLPSTGPSPGTTPGGAVHIATACRVRTATPHHPPAALPAGPTPLGPGPLGPTASCGEGCTPRRVGSPPPPARTRPGNLRGLAGKSQLRCWARFQAERGSECPRPVRLCPPRPGPPRANEPPRPWPGARPSSAAQMPRRSRRVGT